MSGRGPQPYTLAGAAVCGRGTCPACSVHHIWSRASKLSEIAGGTSAPASPLRWLDRNLVRP